MVWCWVLLVVGAQFTGDEGLLSGSELVFEMMIGMSPEDAAL